MTYKISISGMSAVGKTSTIKLLQELHNFTFSISTTTRAPRPGEIHGQHYHFVTKQQFQDLLQQQQIIEHTIYLDHYYGTHINQLHSHTNIIFDLIPYPEIKTLLPNVHWILLDHNNKSIIKQRLLTRDSNLHPTLIAQRLQAIDNYTPDYNLYNLIINVTHKTPIEIVHDIMTFINNTRTTSH